jgi:hypothetical protein
MDTSFFGRFSLIAFLSVWAGVWLGLVVVLVIFWHRMPIFISWPLALFEALIVPNPYTVKKIFTGASGDIAAVNAARSSDAAQHRPAHRP